MARNFTSEITKFLGLNESDLSNCLKKGESPFMKNLKITESFALAQREGYRTLFQGEGEGRGIWSGNLGGRECVVFVSGEKVFSILDLKEKKELGSLETSTGEVSFFNFDSRLYILDGKKIKEVGEEALFDIEPYVPLVAISLDYMGSGVPFEGVNLLTGKKRVSFTLDGEHKTLTLPEKMLDSVDKVTFMNEEVDKSRYTVDLEQGRIVLKDGEWNTSPNSLEVTYTKATEGEAEKIHRMRWAIAYGGANDTSIFLWGDSEYPCHVRYSGIRNGESGMDYFPELSFNKIASSTPVTSLLRHYDRLMIFTESEAFYTYGEERVDLSSIEYTVYPVKTLSSGVGCASHDFAKLIDNTPVTVTASGLYRWTSSSVRDERNAEEIGERIRKGLRRMGKGRVRSFDRACTSELFIWQEDSLYVYNYALGVFYYYEGFEPAGFTEMKNGALILQKTNSDICIVEAGLLDDGKTVEFVWETDYDSFEGIENKNVHTLEFDTLPTSATTFLVDWVSERISEGEGKLVNEYRLTDFSHLDFENFVFRTTLTPIRLYKRIKAKRVKGFKIILRSDEEGLDFSLVRLAVNGRKINSR